MKASTTFHNPDTLAIKIEEREHKDVKWVDIVVSGDDGAHTITMFGVTWSSIRSLLNIAEDTMYGRFDDEEVSPLSETNMASPSVTAKINEWLAAPMCPRCGGAIPNDEQPGAYMGALSRTDNSTEICSSCGSEEALQDLIDGECAPQSQWFVTQSDKEDKQ